MSNSAPHVTSPRISVVIPNYNRADLLEETLRSVRATADLHIIVVDDCSPEVGTSDRLREYHLQGLIDDLVILDSNVGMAAALNRGIARANTEFVLLLSNDDLLELDAPHRLAELLDGNPRAAAACGAFQCFGATDRYYQPPPFDPWLLLFESRWPACYLLRRQVWVDGGGLNEQSLFEDWNAYLSYAARGYDVEVLDGLVYHYRTTDGESLWKTVRARYREQYNLLREQYPALFAQERELRKSSPASWRTKALARPLRVFRCHRPVAATELIIRASRWRAFAWLFRGSEQREA